MPNFVKTGQKVAEILQFFYFSRRRRFVFSFLDHPRNIFGGLYKCAKFCWNPCSSFDNMWIWIFHMFGLKMPIHAPKIMVFGQSYPLNGEVYQYINRAPKRHIFAWKDIIWHTGRENQSTGATFVHDKEKKDKERKRPYSGKLAIWPDHQCHPIEIPFGMAGGLPAVVISFKFHQHRLSSYQAVRSQNLADLVT